MTREKREVVVRNDYEQDGSRAKETGSRFIVEVVAPPSRRTCVSVLVSVSSLLTVSRDDAVAPGGSIMNKLF